jgi:hypothetical protein
VASRKRLLLTIFVAAGLVALLFLGGTYTYKSFLKPMSVHDRVTHVVQNWARMPSSPTDKQELEVIWGKSSGFEFFPYAAQHLATDLQNEFHDSKKTVVQFTDIAADANPKGKIKTVKDLATAVRQNYEPQ